MKVSDFSFELPESLIAQSPAARREDARLLLVRRQPGPGEPLFEDCKVADLPDLYRSLPILSQGLWVRNRSKVIPARIYVRRPTGGRHEILLIEEKAPWVWRALVRNSAKMTYPCSVMMEQDPTIDFEVLDPETVSFEKILKLGRWENLKDFLRLFGEMPLPPYIHCREPARDEERYQSVWADESKAASVAAPTASLHFSKELEKTLIQAGLEFCDLYLHVGLGTFESLRKEKVEDNELHSELFEVPVLAQRQIQSAWSQNRPVIAIGTTSMRVMESLELAELTGEKDLKRRTQIFLHPKNPPKKTSALWTNFHLPESSLFMLVAAFAGSLELAKKAYQHAIDEKYRFFSYGDASLWI